MRRQVKYEITLTPTLELARKRLADITLDIAHLQVDSGIKDIDPKEYLKEMVHDGMMEATFEWARSFSPLFSTILFRRSPGRSDSLTRASVLRRVAAAGGPAACRSSRSAS